MRFNTYRIISILAFVECVTCVPSVVINSGTVVGSRNDSTGVDTFLGIPFAQPPVADLRYRAPQPITKSFGTLQATTTPCACPQFSGRVNLLTTSLGAIAALGALTGPSTPPQSEDCLYLNVQRPVTSGNNTRYPVLVYIHGGGFEQGYAGSEGSTPVNGGSIIVERSVELGHPIIYVALQYRLGLFGFLAGKEIQDAGVSNLGLRDQRLALQWVHDNIAAFGGDPSKVTIYGESAGAWSVTDQLLIKRGDNTYNGRSLFSGAIGGSGAILPADRVSSARAQGIFDTVVKVANCTAAGDRLACLRIAPYNAFNSAVNNALPGFLNYESLNLAFLARPDPTSDFFPQSGEQALQQGQFARVPFLIGDLEDEGTFFSLTSDNLTTTQQLVTSLQNYFQSAPATAIQALVDAYPEDVTQGSPFRTGIFNAVYPQFKRLASIVGDVFFNLTRRYQLNKICHTVKCWSYLATFNYGYPVLGTYHGQDLPLVFANATVGYPPRPAGLLDYMLSFVVTGEPNALATALQWPQYVPGQRKMMNFGTVNNSLITDNFRAREYSAFESLIGTLLH